jgi:hypothetical protein
MRSFGRNRPVTIPHNPPARTSAGPCDWFLLAADRQAFTPFCPPPLQYKPAVFCTHSHKKPMSSLSAASIGLKCSLSLHCESFCINNKPSMVANAFLRCQLARLCVRVGGFRESSPRRSKGMRVWLLPKVFHTCGKNCGNSPSLGPIPRLTPVFRGSSMGRNRKNAIETAQAAFE